MELSLKLMVLGTSCDLAISLKEIGNVYSIHDSKWIKVGHLEKVILHGKYEIIAMLYLW